QAEDGIRDSSVTGVQTCALPISNSCRPMIGRLASARFGFLLSTAGLPVSVSIGCLSQITVPHSSAPHFVTLILASPACVSQVPRSEERRVGKECWIGVCGGPVNE